MLLISELYVHIYSSDQWNTNSITLLHLLCIIYFVLDYTSFTDSDRESNGEEEGTDCVEMNCNRVFNEIRRNTIQNWSTCKIAKVFPQQQATHIIEKIIWNTAWGVSLHRVVLYTMSTDVSDHFQVLHQQITPLSSAYFSFFYFFFFWCTLFNSQRILILYIIKSFIISFLTQKLFKRLNNKSYQFPWITKVIQGNWFSSKMMS